MTIKLLYVCLGNICRSAAAEGISHKIIELKYNEKDIFVDSAGTYGGHTGELPDSRMSKAGADRGYDFISISRKITTADLDNFDFIVTMDDSNYDDIMNICNENNRLKLHKMSDFCLNHKVSYIPDPYYGGEDGFEYVIDILEDGCSNLLEAIFANEIK